MKPTVSQVHVNAPLTNVSIAYLQEQRKYVASMVFPNLPSQHKSNSYYIYSKADFYRDEMQKRAAGTAAARSGYGLTTDTYDCDVFALSQPIPDEIVANQDAVLNAKNDATRMLTQKGLIKLEKQFASNFFKTGVWTGSSTGTDIVPSNLWDTASGDPVKDIGNEIDAVEEKTGYEPNIAVCSKKVFRALQNNEDIKDRIKFTGVPSNSTITAQMLAGLFGIDALFVASATNNTALEKTDDSATMASIINKTGFGLFYRPQSPGIMVPSAGYTFTWGGLAGNAEGTRIKDYRDENVSSDIVQIDMAFDQKVVAADLGVYFNGVIS